VTSSNSLTKQSNGLKTSLADRAYDIIQERIITMALDPGRQLDEKQLVIELGIGRTPIREALFRLASEFLVETRLNKGFIGRPLTLQNIKAMFEALHVLDLGAATLAVHQNTTAHVALMRKAQKRFEAAIEKNALLRLVWANHEFHMHFAGSCANEYLIKALRDVRYEANRLAYLSFGEKTELAGDLLEHYRSVCREHHQIMNYLERKDLSKLKETIETHIRSFQRRIVIYLTSSIS